MKGEPRAGGFGPRRVASWRGALALLALAAWRDVGALAADPIAVLPVSEVKAGMKGLGRTVLKGSALTEFRVEILGVLKGVRPGFDMILARCQGANLEYTGVIAGMSGSPIYVEGKLLGAIAFTWAFNKEPIAGITPFEQMKSFAARPADTGLTWDLTPQGTAPAAMLDLAGDWRDGLRRAARRQAAETAAAGEHGLRPLALPLAASGFSASSLTELRQELAPFGLLPVAGGGGADANAKDSPAPPIVPGGVLAASLVTGDFDLSGIGTVTHVSGDQVWGWGHPFLSSGRCQYVLRGGQIHLVNAKQDVSTKMGSPLGTFGTIESDVSTCIAGRLGVAPDMMPLELELERAGEAETQRISVRIARHPLLVGSLISAVITSALEGHGGVAQEVTLDLDCSIAVEGLAPLVISDTFSGPTVAGSRGVEQLLGMIPLIADRLARNPFQPARLEAIRCRLRLRPERTSAFVNGLRLAENRVRAGETVVAFVRLRPHKAEPLETAVRLALPADLPPGSYTLTACDASNHLKNLFNEEPQRLMARNLDELADSFRVQLAEKRRTLYLRIVTPEQGLVVGDAHLPQLPASARAAFSSDRASGGAALRRAMFSRTETDYVIDGSTSLKLTVLPAAP